MPRVFLSYRRQDAPGYVGHIYEHLAGRFGEDSVFRDIHSIDPGTRFAEVIAEKVSTCDVLVALIGKAWLSAKDERGALRLYDPHDWVRAEIEAALTRGIRVIPVLLGGATMPREDALPPSLRPICEWEAVNIHDEHFQAGLSRLIRAIELIGTAAGHERRWVRFAAPGALLAAGLGAVLLGFSWRVPSAYVELDLKVSEVGFALDSSQALFTGVPVAGFGASGLSGITMPEGHTSRATAVRITPAHAPPGQPAITLPGLSPPAGTHVWLQCRGSDPPHFRLSLRGKGLDLRASVIGRVTFAFAGAARPLNSDYSSPAPVELRPDTSDPVAEFVDLDLTLARAEDLEFSRSLQVRDLSFTAISSSFGAPAAPRQVSAVSGGSLRIEPPRGMLHSLAPGDRLQFASSRGELRSLRLGKDEAGLRFAGLVTGMSLGSPENRTTLMPTAFEWLRARHPLAMVAGAIVYLASLVFLFRRERRSTWDA